MLKVVSCFILVLFHAGSPVAAQDAGLPAVLTTVPLGAVSPAGPGSDRPSYRTGVELVALTVTVTDEQKQFVPGLRAEDFKVFEDGIAQSVSYFGVADVPMDVALLVDSSASMRDTMPIVQQAAAGLLRTLRPGDRATLVEFRHGMRTARALTGDVAGVIDSLQALSPGGGTSLYNALYVNLKEFERLARQEGEVRRRAIVVLSDGDDTSSMLAFEDVLEQARRSRVSVYTVSLKSQAQIQREKTENGGKRYRSEADYAMRALAEQTGARSFFPEEAGELKEVYRTVAEELASQYAVGYVPRNTARDGAWRRVVVTIPDHPGARPRTRAGYYAAEARAVAAERERTGR